MAARRRRKTSRRRRRNPVRGTGALIINPRRKRRVKRRRAAPRRRVRRIRRNSVLALRTNRRRRVVRRKRRTNRKPRRRTYAMKRRSNPRRKIVYRYRKPRRKKRKNPSVKKMTTALAQSFRKIPLIGPFLANVVGFIGPAAFGAVGVEPTMQAAKMLAPYAPGMNASLFYVLSGLGLAALVNSKWNPMSATLKKQLAIGIASATGAVGYYKWRTGQDATLSGEYGLLEYGDLGDFQYSVIPGYGATDEDEDMAGYYAGASYGDAWGAPSDFSLGELQVALAGPRAWRKNFRKARLIRRHQAISRRRAAAAAAAGQSTAPAEEGHRWGWLIKLIGFSNFQAVAALPKDERRAYIAQIKAYAIDQAQQYAESSMSDMGALMYAV